jgi:hypothetical protein
MRRLLLTIVTLLAGCSACLAQVSTLGTTAMGLATTPGAIVTSPLNGPSPFSATTLAGTPGTTLAPVPMASDPATPGTVVTCYPLLYLAFSAQPATSFMSVSNSILPPSSPAVPALPSPTIAPTPISAPSMGTVSTSAQGTAAATMSSPAMTPATPMGTIPSPILGSTTGTTSPVSPLGNSSTTVCSSTPGGPPTNGAALPLSTPEIPSSPSPGTIQPAVTDLSTTSIDPATTVMPTPNTSACAESMTMNLATPGTMPSANATGAAATPGVSPASPSGC